MFERSHVLTEESGVGLSSRVPLPRILFTYITAPSSPRSTAPATERITMVVVPMEDPSDSVESVVGALVGLAVGEVGVAVG